MKSAALCLCFFSLCLFAGDETAKLQEYSRQLREYRDQTDSISNLIEDHQSRIDSLSETEGNMLTVLSEIENMMDSSTRRLENVSAQYDTLSAEVEMLNDSLLHLQRKRNERMEQMKERLREMNRTGRPQTLELLLQSRSPREMFQKIHYAKILSERDRVLLNQLENTQSRLEVQRAEMELREEKLLLMKEQLQQEQEHYARQKTERTEIISTIRESKESWMSAVEELEQAQEDLLSLIEQMATKRDALAQQLKALETFSDLKGMLSWPVSGELTQTFGRVVHPEYQTITRSNGIDISAPRGESVVSVAPGVVSYTGRLRGYGNIVMIAHQGDYNTVYAHLADIHVSEGDEVGSESIIATVGESGSLDGPKLHFEIREDARAVDPQEWLKSE
jgi:septal ring factor EnvC (AmiA/AmiB activator)